MHSTITEIYGIIISNRKGVRLEQNREKILSEAMITYNNAIHSATKLTPYELYFDKNIKYSYKNDMTSFSKFFILLSRKC